MNNNFASLVTGIAKGRKVYSSVRRLILFLVGTGLSQILLILGSLLLGLQILLIPIKLLWLNVIKRVIQDFALTFGPGNGN